MITIKSDQLSASIKSLGAELCSLKSNKQQVEYIWQGDKTFWGRHSPVLFPIVGRLKGDSYLYDGKSYPLGQHGFARDSEFELVKSSENSCQFELNSDDRTRAVFPFEWSLKIGYILLGNVLTIVYSVKNNGPKDLLFSIGAHPAFNCPLFDNEKRSDYELRFNREETLESQIINEGLRTSDSKPVFQNKSGIPIDDDLFKDDALVFSGLNSDRVTLSTTDKDTLSVSFPGFPYLGIWSKNEDAPFVCIEPWHGVADSQDHNQYLKDKEGIKSLKSGDSFAAELKIEIH